MAVTKEEARLELDRRAAPKGSPKRENYPRREVMQQGNKQLAAIAGKRAARKPALAKQDQVDAREAAARKVAALVANTQVPDKAGNMSAWWTTYRAAKASVLAG